MRVAFPKSLMARLTVLRERKILCNSFDSRPCLSFIVHSVVKIEVHQLCAVRQTGLVQLGIIRHRTTSLTCPYWFCNLFLLCCMIDFLFKGCLHRLGHHLPAGCIIRWYIYLLFSGRIFIRNRAYQLLAGDITYLSCSPSFYCIRFFREGCSRLCPSDLVGLRKSITATL